MSSSAFARTRPAYPAQRAFQLHGVSWEMLVEPSSAPIATVNYKWSTQDAARRTRFTPCFLALRFVLAQKICSPFWTVTRPKKRAISGAVRHPYQRVNFAVEQVGAKPHSMGVLALKWAQKGASLPWYGICK